MACKEQQPIQRHTPEKQPWMERSSSLSSVSIFLSDEQGRLLMVQDIDEHGGKWSPIAGYVDDLLGEEPEAAVLREAKEELGLSVRLDELLGVWHYYEKNGKHHDTTKPTDPSTKAEPCKMHIGYAFRGTILDGTFVMQSDEIQNYAFFTPEQIERLHKDGFLKTPEYNYDGYKLWAKGTKHPLEIVRSNARVGTI